MYFLVLLSALLACAAAVPLSDTKPRLDGRIVGGTTTTIQRFPFMVSLRWNNGHICSGSIISSRWVLTAAHCVERNPLTSYSIRSGSTFFNSGGTIHSISRRIIHPSYNRNTLNFDVALLQVSSAFTFNTARQSIPLRCSAIPPGTNVIIVGWGSTSEGGPVSTTLREVTVQIVSDAVCNSAYASFGGITANMICAGVPGGGRGACQGDSGSALITLNPLSLVGIFSWGVGCARPNFPGVYTRVSAVCNWIINNAV